MTVRPSPAGSSRGWNPSIIQRSAMSWPDPRTRERRAWMQAAASAAQTWTSKSPWVRSGSSSSFGNCGISVRCRGRRSAKPITVVEQRGPDTDRDGQVSRSHTVAPRMPLSGGGPSRSAGVSGVASAKARARTVRSRSRTGQFAAIGGEHVERGHDGGGLRDRRSVDASLVRPMERHRRTGLAASLAGPGSPAPADRTLPASAGTASAGTATATLVAAAAMRTAFGPAGRSCQASVRPHLDTTQVTARHSSDSTTCPRAHSAGERHGHIPGTVPPPSQATAHVCAS